jgi:hypothetical protein
MDTKNGNQPQMNPPSRDFENVTKDRRATADKLQIYADKDHREWIRLRQAYGATGYELSRIKTGLCHKVTKSSS